MKTWKYCRGESTPPLPGRTRPLFHNILCYIVYYLLYHTIVHMITVQYTTVYYSYVGRWIITSGCEADASDTRPECLLSLDTNNNCNSNNTNNNNSDNNDDDNTHSNSNNNNNNNDNTNNTIILIIVMIVVINMIIVMIMNGTEKISMAPAQGWHAQIENLGESEGKVFFIIRQKAGTRADANHSAALFANNYPDPSYLYLYLYLCVYLSLSLSIYIYIYIHTQ